MTVVLDAGGISALAGQRARLVELLRRRPRKSTTSGVMLRRGDVWEVTGQRRRMVLVVSHGMYNDQPGIPTVLTMPVLAGKGDDLGTWCVPIGAGEVAVVDHVGRTAKAVFERRVRVADSQVVMDVNNALFKILSTN